MTSEDLSKKNTNPTINVLVLGAGYVGKSLAHSPSSENVNFILRSRQELDYANTALLRKVLFNNSIDYVINCSGFTGRPNVDEAESKKKECWELNVAIPLKISEACKSCGVQYIHISSGCIYSGYETEFTETDEPNFGLFNTSSFYSKTKHEFELLNDYGCTIRVRMPFCNSLNPRSYLTKILKYDNLVNYRNSKTYIPDLVRFINYITSNKIFTNKIGVLNFVNPDAQDTKAVVNAMTVYGITNPNWNYVDIEKLNMAAPRSNCVLSIDKLKTEFPDFKINSEVDALNRALFNIKLEKTDK